MCLVVLSGRVARVSHCQIASRVDSVTTINLDFIDASAPSGANRFPLANDLQLVGRAVVMPIAGELVLEAGDTLEWNAGVAGAADISLSVIESPA